MRIMLGIVLLLMGVLVFSVVVFLIALVML